MITPRFQYRLLGSTSANAAQALQFDIPAAVSDDALAACAQRSGAQIKVEVT
jgi:hypothetical protein